MLLAVVDLPYSGAVVEEGLDEEEEGGGNS